MIRKEKIVREALMSSGNRRCRQGSGDVVFVMRRSGRQWEGWRTVERSGRVWKGQGDCGKVRETVERSGRLWKGLGDSGKVRKTI